MADFLNSARMPKGADSGAEGQIEDFQQREISSLYQISKIASNAKNLDALWQPLFSEVLKIMDVDAGTIMILEGDFLVRKIARGLGEEIMKEPPIPSSKGGISWKAVQTRQPVVINDLSKEKIASKALAEGDFHSLITVPMMVRDQVIGVISIFTRKERNFSEKDLSLFSVIANQAGLAIISIQSAMLLKENRKRLAELESLNQISKSVSTLFDFEETLFSIVGQITKQLRGDMGVITLFDHKEKLLKALEPAFNLTSPQVRDLRMRSDEGITGRAFCKGVPVLLNQVDEETNKIFLRAKISGVESILAAPLKVKSQTLGVIHIFSKNKENFQQDELRLFSILSSQAAVVVNSSYMYREISEERKKDNALLSSIGEGVLAVDENQKIILLNPAGEQITGYLEEELLGKTVAETLNLKDTPITKALKTGKSEILSEIILKKRDQESFPARFSVAATLDVNDKIIGAIVAFADISREKEVERMKQELISIATHELRTPITGIKGYLDMILAGDTGGVNEETKEIMQEMAGINQRLADLVDDLLNVGRIEQGRIEVKPVSMDISKSISEVIKEMSIQAKKKKLALVFDSDDTIFVKADPDRTRQILVNLIGNAIKYTPAGKVEVVLEEKGHFVFIHVKDTGLGMSKDGQKQLFTKFYRVKTEKTRTITGTGLGLWICKQIVEMMGGRIWVESQENKGSKFSFSLPMA